MLTALVVGDSAGTRHRVALLLRLAGWEVFHSTGTEPARRAALRLHPDLVVTDLRMRGGHGVALVHQLRRDGCNARFVVVTGRAGERLRTELALQDIGCLAKPVEPRALLRFLRTDVPAPRVTRVIGEVRDVRRPTPVVASAAAALTGSEAKVSDPNCSGDRYVEALPHRVSVIVTAMQAGDVAEVAATALDLATASFQEGHAAIAHLCNVIAAEAYRGRVSHTRLMELLVAASPAGSPV